MNTWRYLLRLRSTTPVRVDGVGVAEERERYGGRGAMCECTPAFAFAGGVGIARGVQDARCCAARNAVRVGVGRVAQGAARGVGVRKGVVMAGEKGAVGVGYGVAEDVDEEDLDFDAWVAKGGVVEEEEEEGEEKAIPLASLLEDTTVPRRAGEMEDEELGIEAGFGDDDDDDDGDDDDEDEDNDDLDEDDDEDEELAARAEADDDFEGDGRSNARALGNPRDLSLAGGDADDQDDIADEDDLMDPVPVDEIDDSFISSKGRDGVLVVGDDADDSADVAEDDDVVIGVVGEEEDDSEDVALLFGDEDDDDIRNAADLLSGSRLLGLGVEGGRRRDASAVASFALGETPVKKRAAGALQDVIQSVAATDSAPSPLPGSLVDDDKALDDVDAEQSSSRSGSGPRGLDDYVDVEEEEDDGDAEFAQLTSQSNFGRVWELNDDNYVTITEPGQSYVYELDEEDEEDQEMATMRRGKQGGWSGGLQTNSSDTLPKGSREWIARKSYELVANAAAVEMFKWTRRHQGPPPDIASLYPDMPPPPTPLGRTTLQFSTPASIAPIIGTDSSVPQDDDRAEVASPRRRNSSGTSGEPIAAATLGDVSFGLQGQNALERAVKFPCQYKFKVEGGGERFIEHLGAVVENVLGRTVPSSAYVVEPAGRYERVVIIVEVESARQVTDLYDALRSCPSVKFSYG